MDEETRLEIETLKNRTAELAACVRTLQALAAYHDEELKALAASTLGGANVHTPV